MIGQGLAKPDVCRFNIQKPRHLLHLGQRKPALAGDQFCNELRRHPSRMLSGLGGRVLGNCVMGDNQDDYPIINRRPAQDIVLAQRPVLVQGLFEVDQIASLTQRHFLREAGQLIQVRRKVG